MKWFRRKVRVTSNVFVSRQVENALEKQKSLRNLFSVSKTEISDEFKLFIFSSFLILLAMSIAKIDDGVQLTYTNHVVGKTEGIFGRADEEYIKRRFMEYLGAYVKDTDEQKSHLMPNTLTLALDSIPDCCKKYGNLLQLRHKRSRCEGMTQLPLESCVAVH